MDTSPACIHVEESCEALLSKVTEAMRKHCGHGTHQHYSDVFNSIRPSRGVSTMRPSVSQVVIDAIRRRLLDVVGGTAVVVPRLRWISDKVAFVQQSTATCHDAPHHPMLRKLGHDVVEIELRRCLRGLVQAGKVTPPFVQALLTVCGPRRDDALAEELRSSTAVRAPSFLQPASFSATGSASQEQRPRKIRRRQ
jgi:hypothetical protein